MTDQARFDIGAVAATFPATADTLLLDRYLVDNPHASARVFRVYRGTPAHFHRGSDEFLYVFSGRGTFWIGDDTSKEAFGPGQLLFFKQNIVHALPRHPRKPRRLPRHRHAPTRSRRHRLPRSRRRHRRRLHRRPPEPSATPMHSLKRRLIGLWALSLLAGLAVGALLVVLQRQTVAAPRPGRADAVAVHACRDLIRDRVAFYLAGAPAYLPLDDRLDRDLAQATGLALSDQNGVEGGIWQAGRGPLAYAFPTYEGTGPKTDLPAAERPAIAAINAQALADEQAAGRSVRTRAQSILMHACPLSGPIPRLTAWTMIRVRATAGLAPLRLGLFVLFALLVLMAAWLGRILVVWSRHLGGIEAALARAGPDGIPALPPTGERELDRIVAALNDATIRLATARREQTALSRRLADNERLASLGRVAAGVAHEIRNPIAAARLQGENAMAGDDQRRRTAIADMLAQLDRLDTLVAELLSMTHRAEPRPETVTLGPFLDARLALHRAVADASRIVLERVGEGQARFDPALIGRILDNLLGNAIRHTPPGGRVTVTAQAAPPRITVADTGSGIAPEIGDRLFDPFVTSRADGTGLGLAIARELARAHGAQLTLERAGGPGEGALFALTL